MFTITEKKASVFAQLSTIRLIDVPLPTNGIRVPVNIDLGFALECLVKENKGSSLLKELNCHRKCESFVNEMIITTPFRKSPRTV